MIKNLCRLLREYKNFKNLGLSFSEFKRLKNANHNPITTELFGKKLQVNSAFWYLHGLEELFVEQTYRFQSKSPTPRIIDCGANTGLSAIFFKRTYPNSRLTAFEPDQDIFTLLTSNLATFNFKDVELVNKAIWKNNEGIKFLASGGVGGRISDDNNSQAIVLQTKRLRELLDEKIDFLKIDIEGAEYDVIKDCSDKLHNVQNIFIEYHSLEKNEQMLDEILKILKNAGFKYYIKEAWNNQPSPYTNQRLNLFDLQLNIFGYRIE